MTSTLPQIFDPADFTALLAEANAADNSINTQHPDFWMTSADRAPVYDALPTIHHWHNVLLGRYNSSLAARFGVDFGTYISAMDAYHAVVISPLEAINGGGGYGPQFEPSPRVTAWTNLDAWKAENTWQPTPAVLALMTYLNNDWTTRQVMAEAGVVLTNPNYGYIRSIPRYMVGTAEGGAPGGPATSYSISITPLPPRLQFVPFSSGTASAVDFERNIAFGASPEQTAAMPSPNPRACDIIGINALGLNADPATVFPPGTPNLRYNPDGSLIMPTAWLVTRGIDLVGGLADHMFVVIGYELGGDVVAAYSFAPDDQGSGTLVRHPWSETTETTVDDGAAWHSLVLAQVSGDAAISREASAIRIDAPANYVAALGNHATSYLGSVPATGTVSYELVPNLIIGAGANSNSAARALSEGAIILAWSSEPGRTLTNQRLPPRLPLFGVPGHGQWRIAINVPETC